MEIMHVQRTEHVTQETTKHTNESSKISYLWLGIVKNARSRTIQQICESKALKEYKQVDSLLRPAAMMNTLIWRAKVNYTNLKNWLSFFSI